MLNIDRINVDTDHYRIDEKSRLVGSDGSTGSLIAPSIIGLTDDKCWIFKKLTHSQIQKINDEVSKEVLDIGEALKKVFEKPTTKHISEAREATGNVDEYVHPNTVYSCFVLKLATVYPQNLDLRSLKMLSDAFGMEFENLASYALRIYRGDKNISKKK